MANPGKKTGVCPSWPGGVPLNHKCQLEGCIGGGTDNHPKSLGRVGISPEFGLVRASCPKAPAAKGLAGTGISVTLM